MEEKFKSYKPKFQRHFESGKLLHPILNLSDLDIEELILTEIKSNLIGDLITRLGLIVIPIVLGLIGVNFEDKTSKYVGIGLGLFMLFAGIGLLPETIRKLKSNSKRDSLKVNSKGIDYKKVTEAIFIKFKWEQISNVALKIYRDEYGFTPYLLILTNRNKLIDINISLLKTAETKFTTKSEWLKTLHLKEPEFETLRKVIGKYLKTNIKNSTSA